MCMTAYRWNKSESQNTKQSRNSHEVILKTAKQAGAAANVILPGSGFLYEDRLKRSEVYIGLWSNTNHFLPSCSFAYFSQLLFRAATRCSGSKPNFRWSSLSGAEAPKVFMPMMSPDVPT